MLLYRRVVTAVATLALACGLSVVLSGVAPAGAAESPSARCTTATQNANAAQSSYSASVAAEANAGSKVAKLRKKLKKAKAHHAPVKKVKKLKKQLKKAKKAHAVNRGQVTSAFAHLLNAQRDRNAACAQQTGDPLSPAQLTQLLTLLRGVGTTGFSPDQVLSLVGLLFPTELASLNPSQLTTLLGALNALDPAQLGNLAALLEGFAGVLDPAQVTSLVATITGLFSGLPAGGLSLEQMTAVVAGLVSTLSTQLDAFGLGAVGDVLQLLLTALAGGSLETLDLAGLTSLLDELLPGVTDSLDAGQLSALLGLVNSGGLDPAVLTGLLGGAFDPAQILALIQGTAGQDLLAGVLAQLLPQLAALGGGGFDLPTDPAALLGVLSGVTNLLDTLLGGGICTLLPILCP